jgi:DNA repair protein RecO (recombination protein O)
MSLYRDHGIVLRTVRLGEADRIISLLTEHHGKVRAVAKGVRKTKSKFGSRLEPTSHVALQLYEGRELDIVTQAETVDRLFAVRTDLDLLGRAAAMLEVADHVALEREPDPGLYRLLLGALRTLAADESPLVVAGFFLKLLAHEGVGPVFDRCTGCGSEDDLVAVEVMDGGARCRACRRGQGVSDGAFDLLNQILGGQLGRALRTPASPETHEVEHVALRFVEHHVERRVRALTLLDRG